MYELLLAPLSTRERTVFSSLIILTVVFLAITTAGASNSLVGSYIYSPFSACKSNGSSWSWVQQATGLPDAELADSPQYGRTARLGGGTSPLICSQADISHAAAHSPGVRIYLAVAQSTGEEQVFTEGGHVAETTLDNPPAYLALPATSAEIDKSIRLEWSSDNAASWQTLAELGPSNLTSTVIDLPLPVEPLERLDGLSVRITPLSLGPDPSRLAIDSVGLTYEAGKPAKSELLAFASGESDQRLPVFAASKELSAQLELDSPNTGLVQGVARNLPGVQDDAPSAEISATLLSVDGEHTSLETETSWLGTRVDGNLAWRLDISPPSQLKPGRYTLETAVSADGTETVRASLEILWGVAAINTAKSSYLPEEPIELMMSLLDERGATVCDADISVSVKLDNREVGRLSTDDGQISTTDTCELYGSHIEPDYTTWLQLSRSGTYVLELTAQKDDLSYLMVDTLQIDDQPEMTVTRTGPTRLFPINNYPMEISVEFTEDFNGTITEYVPESFRLVSQPDERPYGVDEHGKTKKLTWDLSAQAGDILVLKYTFDPPDISPAFYTLGKLEAMGEGTEFTEHRYWQLAGDAIGRMILFYDGATAPAGWTCVSCSPGDDFYQVFPRGADTYGGNGGTASHNHTISTSVSPTGTTAASQNQTGTTISDNTHSHSGSTTLNPSSNLPSYRQLKLIRYDAAGEPASLPAGVIGMFDSTLPGDWTQYSAQNGFYPRGENTAGTTGGSNTHQHSISGSLAAAAGGTHGTANGSPVSSANAGHTHTYAGNSSNINSEPPYISVVFAQLGSSAAPPDGLIAMWDDENPANWSKQSGPSGSFHQLFFKGSAMFGTTGGNSSHNHVDTNLTSSAPAGGNTNSKSGSVTASSSHTHSVTVSNYSTVSHLPPYRDVVVSKRVPQSDVEQSAYRLFSGSNSTDVGSALAAQNTAASAPRQGTPFRLRLLLHVSNADLAAGNRVFKLQYATRSGTCDTSFSGESYADVETSSGAVRFYDNASPADGATLTNNANDPSHSGHSVIDQTYEEANNFTNNSAVNIGQDGLWDFSLVDFSASPSTNYCFRVVRSNNDLLENYSIVPEIITDDGNGHMLLFYDGGSAPSGWTCLSCNPGDEFYQRFFRGAAAYGSTGGAANHTHTASAVVNATTGNNIDSAAGSAIASGSHSHTFTPVLGETSNLPTYRQLKVIRADSSGVPSSLPSGAIAIFDAAVPSGWTQYSAQNGNYIRGENTAGSTGGSLSHTHTITGTTSNGTGSGDGRTSGSQVPAATADHSHTVNDASSSASNEPLFIQVILGQLGSSASAPQNIITLWDGPPPGSWTDMSSSGQPFYQRFIKPAATYGSTGGSTSHNHPDNSISSDGASSNVNRRSGATNSGGTHTHSISISNVSTDNHLPPYIDVVVAKLGSLNTPPDTPSVLDLDQLRTSDDSSIAVGGWTNGGQVKFTSTASDPDNPDDLQICVEVEEVGVNFDDTPTSCGTSVSYNGSPVNVEIIIPGLQSGSDYHWQAQIKDGSGATSAWISFGGNAESATDFSVDSTEPAGAVYDGESAGVDIDLNDGSLSTLEANWNITDTGSGINSYEFSIGTSQGADDVAAWSNLGTDTSHSAESLDLRTSQVYYWNIRATDKAGNDVTISSDGIKVAPTLTFSASPATITFDNLNVSNSYTDTETTVLTTSTNSYNGYQIRAHISSLPTSDSLDVIGLFSGGTYAVPDEWLAEDAGYGYTSNDTTIQGGNLFNSAPCAGGGNPPCFAPFSLSPPGDIVADHTDLVSGSPLTNQNFIITHRVTVPPSHQPGVYQTEIIYSVTARY